MDDRISSYSFQYRPCCLWSYNRPINDKDGQGIEIVLDDQCADTKIEQIQKRDLSELKPGGLGIHILYRIMDHVQYDQRPDAPGIRLTLRKFHKEAAS